MDTTGRDAVQETLNRVHDAIAKVDRLAHMRDNTSNSTVTVSAGGVGVWAAVTACLVMLAINTVLCLLFLDMSRKYDRMQDHLSAIYMIAPQLKPKD